MPLSKLFPAEFPTKASVILEGISIYYFSVIWNSPEANCALVLFQGSVGNSTTLHNIITHPVTDNDGEISVEIGRFLPGTSLSFQVLTQAVTKIDDISLWITNISTGQSEKIRPNTTVKTLSSNEFWKENFTAKLF